MSWSKLRGKAPTGEYELNDYAAVITAFKDWCDARELNFRAEVAAWAKARMEGKDAPAQTAAAVPPPSGAGPYRGRGNRRAKAPLLVCPAHFPGRIFTHKEAGEVCNKTKTYPVSRYVERGLPIPGTRYTFRRATDAEIRASLGRAD